MVCPEGRFDFETLISSPSQIYRGDLASEDQQDFPCNWFDWQMQNWGTKWGASGQSCGVENGKAFIKFDTAWTVPYPIISAFANRFKIPFEHRYFDEGHNFWGIEKWEFGGFSKSKISRIGKIKNEQADHDNLCVELEGYDPRERD